MTVRKGKRAVWPSVLLEARQEVWSSAVYGSGSSIVALVHASLNSTFLERHAQRRGAKLLSKAVHNCSPSYSIAQLANEFASIKVLSLQCRLQNKRCTRCPSPPSRVEP